MICNNCKHELKVGEFFCPMCGTKNESSQNAENKEQNQLSQENIQRQTQDYTQASVQGHTHSYTQTLMQGQASATYSQNFQAKQKSPNRGLKIAFFLLTTFNLVFLAILLLFPNSDSMAIAENIIEAEPKIASEVKQDWNKGGYSLSKIGSENSTVNEDATANEDVTVNEDTTTNGDTTVNEDNYSAKSYLRIDGGKENITPDNACIAPDGSPYIVSTMPTTDALNGLWYMYGIKADPSDPDFLEVVDPDVEFSYMLLNDDYTGFDILLAPDDEVISCDEVNYEIVDDYIYLNNPTLFNEYNITFELALAGRNLYLKPIVDGVPDDEWFIYVKLDEDLESLRQEIYNINKEEVGSID